MQIENLNRQRVEFDTMDIPDRATGLDALLGEPMATVATADDSSGKPLPVLSRKERRAMERQASRVRVRPAKPRATR